MHTAGDVDGDGLAVIDVNGEGDAAVAETSGDDDGVGKDDDNGTVELEVCAAVGDTAATDTDGDGDMATIDMDGDGSTDVDGVVDGTGVTVGAVSATRKQLSSSSIDSHSGISATERQPPHSVMLGSTLIRAHRSPLRQSAED